MDYNKVISLVEGFRSDIKMTPIEISAITHAIVDNGSSEEEVNLDMVKMMLSDVRGEEVNLAEGEKTSELDGEVISTSSEAETPKKKDVSSADGWVEHEITDEDLANNPILIQLGVKIGTKVDFPPAQE